MAMEQPLNTVREAVGVFDDYTSLHETIKDLETSGFGRRQISVRGSDLQMIDRFGQPQLEAQQLEDNPIAPHSPIVGPEELGVAKGVLIGGGMLVGFIGAVIPIMVAGGAVTTGSLIILALAIAAGALIGWGVANLLDRDYDTFFSRQVDKGGLVLWVVTPSEEAERKAEAILERHGAHDIHIHEMPMAA